ncbi:MAG: hypothetical protein AVDCRST_MAG19-871 [uncultured Thermomicrobiales bacterium]|uniref:Uncharacterized protein n=1 Tax=uncultured Thermomicrobiales bacterium TaxID=1645740 RepID=A0A6J4UI78_9BACT|nr:MAG: hypothetical protein AVDCRST_MAG19-871 [uncultured Thermomicrobiales bacterium]
MSNEPRGPRGGGASRHDLPLLVYLPSHVRRSLQEAAV